MTAMPSTGLPAGVAQILQAEGVLRTYPAGSLIFAEGDPPGPTLIVAAGVVEVSIEGVGPIATVTVDELVGELSAVDGLPRSASARARTDVEVRAIEPIRFAELIASEPDLCRHLLQVLVSRMRRSTVDRGPIDRGIPVDRLASWMLERHRGDGWIEISLEDLATDMGVSRELLSRAIDHLVGRGAVALDRGRLLIRSEATLTVLAGAHSG